MVQPKTPPLSIRPGEVRLAKIDAYALKHGLKRHAAILELLDVALDGPVSVAMQRPTPKPVPGSGARMSETTRRALFGLFAGALAAPYVRPMPPTLIGAPLEFSPVITQATWVRYSGYEVLDIGPADVAAAAAYEWRRVAIPGWVQFASEDLLEVAERGLLTAAE